LDGRKERRHPGLLLVACAPSVLRACSRRPSSDRQRGQKSIAALYQIEAEIRGRSAEERRTVRQERSRPILDEPSSQKIRLAEAVQEANGILEWRSG
jgi:Transposase IS66 family